MRQTFKVFKNPIVIGYFVLAEVDFIGLDELRQAPGVWIADLAGAPSFSPAIATFSVNSDPRYDTEAEAVTALETYLATKLVPLDEIWDKE